MNMFYAIAMSALAIAQKSPVTSDDLGMVNAHADDLYAWADDLECRVGLDVSNFRAAIVNFLRFRDCDSVKIMREFPDYDGLSAMPDYLSAGFVCMAWHNDSCPQFNTPMVNSNDHSGFSLFIDYCNPDKRECDSGGRFAIGRLDAVGCYTGDIYCGDDWNEVLKAMK